MSIPTIIVLISWATFLLFWGVSSLWVKRDVASKSKWRWWWTRALVITAILILWYYSSIGLFSRHVGPLSSAWSPNHSPILTGIGAALTALGVALAIWARIHLGRNWSSHPTLKEGHELVTSGPYQLIRHPIYTGVICAVLGATLVSISAIVVLAASSILFIARIKREETLMLGQFPNQYPEYKKRTWALVPYVW